MSKREKMLKTQTTFFSPRSYSQLLRWIKRKGELVSVGGNMTHEVINAELICLNPIDRLATSSGRKTNIGFAVAEWLAMMTGRSDVDYFIPHISGYDRYSDDGLHVAGAYGPRVQPSLSNRSKNQVKGVIQTLYDDPNSRRAVISVYDGAKDLFDEHKTNTPCTLTLQFLYRNDHLDMITNMRSSDVIKGLTYDLFVFTMIHEFVARQLGVQLGQYVHKAGSMHLYESDIAFEDAMKTKRWPKKMWQMPKLTWPDIELAAQLMENIATDDSDKHYEDRMKLSPYLRNLVSISRAFVMRHDENELALSYYECKDDTLKLIVRQRLGNKIKHWSSEMLRSEKLSK